VELNTINQTKPKMLIVPTLSFPVGPITFFMFSVPWYHVRYGVQFVRFDSRLFYSRFLFYLC
jgi:hypothetical protein